MSRWENSESQPWRYSDMLDDISEMENTEPYKLVTHKSISVARSYLSKWKRVKYLDMILTIDGKQLMAKSFEMVDGFPTLIFEGFKMAVTEYSGEIQTKVRKGLNEYNTKPNHKGKYKVCEGGGWYSNASLYELNGNYYTNGY